MIKRYPVTNFNSKIKSFGDILASDYFLSLEEADELEEEIENIPSENLVTDLKFGDVEPELIVSSCAYFAHSVLGGSPNPPYNGKFLINDHHIEWDELINEHKRLCLLAARDHGKSFFCNFAYPIWRGVTLPKESGYIFSDTQPQAELILSIIKDEFESNPRLNYLVPPKKSMWGARQIRLANGHKIYARGFFTKVRGAHPKWIVVDDGLNDETAYSEIIRRKQKDIFFNSISNMIVPGGQIIVIGTPFHVDDLYGELKNNKRYFYKEYPAELHPGRSDNKALWPARYDLKALSLKKEEIGSIRYTREFLVKPISDDMSLFPDILFRGEPTEQFSVVLGLPKRYWLDKGVIIYMGVDFAMSSSVQADFTVIVVLGRDRFGNRWLIDLFRGKGLPYQVQLSKINELGRKYDPVLIYTEANQMQRIFGDELIRVSDLPIHKFTTGAQKNSLEQGVPELRVLLENGKFRFPRGDERSIELTDLVIDEFKSMSFVDGKIQSVGGHDDTVMAIWIANQAVKAGGFTFSFDEKGKEGREATREQGNVFKESITSKIRQGKSVQCTALEFEEVRSILLDFIEECLGTGNSHYESIASMELARLEDKFGEY